MCGERCFFLTRPPRLVAYQQFHSLFLHLLVLMRSYLSCGVFCASLALASVYLSSPVLADTGREPNDIIAEARPINFRMGNYNGDAVVDAADYTVWRDSFGSTTQLAADGDDDGDVDMDDYNVWVSNFGQYAGSYIGFGFIGDNTALPVAENDVDMVSVKLEAGQFVSIDVDADELGFSHDSYLRVFDSSGSELASNDDFGSPLGPLDSAIVFQAPSADTYYIGLSSFGNDSYDPNLGGASLGETTGDYDLVVEIDVEFIDDLEGNDALLDEPNDTVADSLILGDIFGEPIILEGFIGDNANVLPEDDVDLIQLELFGGEFFSADIDAELNGSQLDAVLRLFDVFGDEVAMNDDNEGLDPRIDFAIVEGGTYFLGVSSFENIAYDPFTEGSGIGETTGEYTLTLEVVAPISVPEPASALLMSLAALASGGRRSRGA